MRFLTAIAAAAGTLAAAAAMSATAPAASAAPAVKGPAWSAIWGGYEVKAPPGKHIGFVGASWTVPKPDPKRVYGPAPYRAAMWVGMDGDSRQSFGPAQCGIWESTPRKGGPVTYDAFWEFAPDQIPQHMTTDGEPARADGSNWLRVQPGEQVAASVQYIDQEDFRRRGYYDFTVYVTRFDPSAGEKITRSYDLMVRPPDTWPAPSVQRQYAEVITEIPTVNGHAGGGALDMGKVRYSYAEYAVQLAPGSDASGPYLPVTGGWKQIMNYWYGKGEVIILPSHSSTTRGSAVRGDAFDTVFHHYGW